MALTTRKWTRTEFEKLSQAGVVPEHERLEPIEGEIVPLTPIDPRHDHTVDCLAMKLVKLFGDDYVVRVQNPVVVGERSEPQPDLVMFPQTYAELLRAESRHPEKASLIVEVSNSSLAYDQNEKLSLYARAGFQPYWIVNLIDDVLEVHTQPVEDVGATFGWRYGSVQRFERDSYLPFLGQDLAVDEFFPGP